MSSCGCWIHSRDGLFLGVGHLLPIRCLAERGGCDYDFAARPTRGGAAGKAAEKFNQLAAGVAGDTSENVTAILVCARKWKS
jgi:hypothetical protein